MKYASLISVILLGGCVVVQIPQQPSYFDENTVFYDQEWVADCYEHQPYNLEECLP